MSLVSANADILLVRNFHMTVARRVHKQRTNPRSFMGTQRRAEAGAQEVRASNNASTQSEHKQSNFKCK